MIDLDNGNPKILKVILILIFGDYIETKPQIMEIIDFFLTDVDRLTRYFHMLKYSFSSTKRYAVGPTIYALHSIIVANVIS